MKKCLTVLALCWLMIAGCSNTETTQTIIYETDYNDLLKKAELLEEENSRLKDEIQNLISVFEFLPDCKLFNPHTVQVGDQIGDFKVVDVYLNESGMEKVVFEGFFKFTGELFPNMYGESKYSIHVSKEDVLNNLPLAVTWQLLRRDNTVKGYFRLLSDEKVSQSIGTDLEEYIWDNVEKGIELKFKVSATFKGFTYWIQPNTGVTSSIELLELISIEEIK